MWRRRPCGVVVIVLDCDFVVIEFELQSRYYVHFRTNALGKGMNPSTMGYIVPLIFIFLDSFGIK